jgi:hypothetical protein
MLAPVSGGKLSSSSCVIVDELDVDVAGVKIAL